MPTLSNYNEFQGYHWETSSIRNHFAYRGVKAPHTNQPYTEALLMGISGGAVMGYFSFAYEGYDPQVAILTRNTFNPLDTILERLGVVQEVKQTGKPEKGVANLIDALEEGVPPIVWADMFSLPYNTLGYDEGMWAMFPLVVYGYELAEDTVWIADRAQVPLRATITELAAARGRVKKDKFRLLILDHPDPDKLVSAVQKGIWDCIKLYTEKPPRGSKNNFGFAAYQRWIKLLTKPKQRLSWAKEFPPGAKMIAGLTSTFERIALFGSNGVADAERNLYADFLTEAAQILGLSALNEIATQFRVSAQAWEMLGQLLLTDKIPPFKSIRELMVEKHNLFLQKGHVALEEMHQINTQLQSLKTETSANFPLSEAEVAAFCEVLAAQVQTIHDLELEAITGLQEVLASRLASVSEP